MATGGGTPKDGDYSKTWKNASAFMDRREPTSSTSRKSANPPKDLDDADPGECLQKDMQDMSIHKDPNQREPCDQED